MGGYHIGAVCKILGVKPHIVRYWEREIPFLSPQKDRSGRRSYSDSDLNTLVRIRHLLYERKYTLQGAKETIWREMTGKDPDARARIASIRADLIRISVKLNESMERLSGGIPILVSLKPADTREQNRGE